MQGKWKFLKGAIAAIAVVLAAGQVSAAPISGTLNMVGSVTTLDGAGGSVVGTAAATYLDFSPTGAGGSFVTLGAATGSFAGIASFTPGTITDFSFAPFGGAISCFWSVAGFCFDLNSIAITQQDAIGLTIVGTGTVSGNGFDATQGFFSFSTQGGGGVDVAFSATTTVPLPGMLGLLGVSLIGLGLLSRRRQEA